MNIRITNEMQRIQKSVIRVHYSNRSMVINLFPMTKHLTFYKVSAEHKRKIKQYLYTFLTV